MLRENESTRREGDRTKECGMWRIRTADPYHVKVIL